MLDKVWLEDLMECFIAMSINSFNILKKEDQGRIEIFDDLDYIQLSVLPQINRNFIRDYWFLKVSI